MEKFKKLKFKKNCDSISASMNIDEDKVTVLCKSAMEASSRTSEMIQFIYNHDDYDMPTKLLAIFGIGGMAYQSRERGEMIDKKFKALLLEFAKDMGIDIKTLKVDSEEAFNAALKRAGKDK